MSMQSKVKVKSRKEEKKASLFIYNYDIKHHYDIYDFKCEV